MFHVKHFVKHLDFCLHCAISVTSIVGYAGKKEIRFIVGTSGYNPAMKNNRIRRARLASGFCEF